MQMMEQLPHTVDTDIAWTFTEHATSGETKRRVISPDILNQMLASYFKHQNISPDEESRIKTVVIAGFLQIHMEIEMYEYPAFPPNLMVTSYPDLDKLAVLMARDSTLLPPPDMPIKHPYDNRGFSIGHFVAKQHKAV